MLGLLTEHRGKCELRGCKSTGEDSSFRAQSITGGGERLEWGGGKHHPKGFCFLWWDMNEIKIPR